MTVFEYEIEDLSAIAGITSWLGECQGNLKVLHISSPKSS